MTADGVDLGVSRETLQKLEHFADLVAKWTRRINLIAPSSIDGIWNRHILDSAQLVRHAPANATSWIDLGSGAGFPGLVIAALWSETNPQGHVTLVESDQRKAAFLRQAARELALAVTIHTTRAESLPPTNADILSARALAPLVNLLPLAARHLAPTGIAIFPKGRNAAAEIEEARKSWRFDLAIRDSVTDHEGRILRIERIERA